jgi:glycosyltransferase involved in cell wall biosynthesis
VNAGRGREAPLCIAVVAACPFPDRRGTPVRIQRLAEGLQQRGHEVHVVTYPHGAGPVAEGLVVHRVARAGTRDKGAPGPSTSKLLVLDPLLARLLRRLLRTQSIDLVHAHHYEGLLVALAARPGSGVPIVYDAHTLLEAELPSYGPRVPAWAKKAVGGRLDRWLPAKADHVIAVSDAIRDTLLAETRLGEDEVTTVSNGVECELFDASAAAGERRGPPVVVFAGNLASYQGIDVLLEAFREVRARRSDVRLRIVTESSFGPYEERARALGIRDAIDLVVTGFEDVPALLASADVAVNPRMDCRGIPLKLLNYMAASKPVVSFAGSAPGVEQGVNGWLVASGDVAGFAHGVLTLLEDPARARQIGERARRHVEARHSWLAMSEAAEGVFRALLGRAASRRGA